MATPAILLLTLAAGVAASQAAQCLEPSVFSAKPPAPIDKACRAGESLYEAIRTSPIQGGVRVEFQLVETGDARWANMNRALLRKYQIRVGAKFCMPLDSGDAAQSALDYD